MSSTQDTNLSTEEQSFGQHTARIKDVARAAGVSTATVSHGINGTKYVTEVTREKVLDAIERFNYHPNAHARWLASGRSNMLGLVMSDISNPFFPDLVKSIEKGASERGYHLMLLDTNYDPTRAADYVRRLRELKVAGVALMTAELDESLFARITRNVIAVDFDNPGPATEHVSHVRIDYANGIEEAVRHLVALGHRRIAHIAGASRIPSGVVRREAFLDSMARHLPDEPAPAVHEGDFRLDGGRRAARELLSAGELPTAVVVANDMMALGAMQEFRAAGLIIPRDISVIGFDDIAFATLCDPRLTTVHSSRLELGSRAVEALLTMIESPERKGVEILIPTHLVTRGSTAPPPPRR